MNTGCNGNGLIARLDFYAEMIRSRRFSSGARDVAYVLLYRHMNGTTGRCDPARATLAEETGLDERCIRRALAELEKSGWWTVGRNEGTAGRGGRPNIYRPNLERGDKFAPPSAPKGGTDQPPLRLERGDNLVRKGGTISPPKPRKNQEEDSPLAPQGACEGDLLFTEGWHLYPSRAPHPNPEKPAKTAFAAALKRGADPASIIRGIANYARYVDEHVSDRQRVAMMATWLNEDRWNDHQEMSQAAARRLGTGLF
jgi:hypothetical protein